MSNIAADSSSQGGDRYIIGDRLKINQMESKLNSLGRNASEKEINSLITEIFETCLYVEGRSNIPALGRAPTPQDLSALNKCKEMIERLASMTPSTMTIESQKEFVEKAINSIKNSIRATPPPSPSASPIPRQVTAAASALTPAERTFQFLENLPALTEGISWRKLNINEIDSRQSQSIPKSKADEYVKTLMKAAEREGLAFTIDAISVGRRGRHHGDSDHQIAITPKLNRR